MREVIRAIAGQAPQHGSQRTLVGTDEFLERNEVARRRTTGALAFGLGVEN